MLICANLTMPWMMGPLHSATAADRVKPAQDLGKVIATETVDLFKVEHIYLSFLVYRILIGKSLMISQRVTAPIQLTFFLFFLSSTS